MQRHDISQNVLQKMNRAECCGSPALPKAFKRRFSSETLEEPGPLKKHRGAEIGGEFDFAFA